MANKKEETTTPESNELSAIAVKSLTNLEEKVEAIDWKLWEIYNIIKTYVETNPSGPSVSAPSVSQPGPSASEIASELAKSLGDGTEKKSVVGKLFGK
tara:strand:- start:2493 stop:2786 length:294 start_codon:yes stop_codon:yes gene_type:complete